MLTFCSEPLLLFCVTCWSVFLVRVLLCWDPWSVLSLVRFIPDSGLGGDDELMDMRLLLVAWHYVLQSLKVLLTVELKAQNLHSESAY